MQGDMLLYSKKIRFQNCLLRTVRTGLFLLFLFPPNLFGQDADPFGSAEDDSLLFGEEFDLGGDDFSFDFDDDEDTTSTDAADDEFSFDFEDDEETAEDSSEIGTDTTAADDDWGLDTSSDYESLITRTADGEENVLMEEVDHPLDFRKHFRGTVLENAGLTLSLYSPQAVGDNLDTWYSFMDFSLTAELPWHYTFDPVNISFMVDMSSFSFDNSFPEGGKFRGMSVMPIARAESFGAEVELGLGMYYPTFGMLLGAGYAYQYHSLYFSAGYRWNWAYNIEPIGSSWWLEPRLTAGVKLW